MIEIQELIPFIKPDTNGLPTLYYEGELRSPELQAEYEKADKVKWIEFINKKTIDGGGFFLKENKDFHYDLVNTNHYIVWIKSTYPQYIKKVLRLIKADFDGMDFICFQNPSQNQSIKEITHFHFLVKIL